MSSDTAIVITCYDLGRTLGEAIDSALEQTVEPAEVVVVDDGSEDALTRQVLARLADSEPRVRLIATEHRGVAAARNVGIAATSAPNVVLLDGDDRFEPSYLEQASEVLAERPDLHFVCCALQAFGRASYRWKPPPYTVAEALGRGACGHISTVFRREVWDHVGGFDSALPAYEDVDFWLRALEAGFHGLILDQALVRYRVRLRSRYHATVQRGEYLRAKQLLLDKHLSAAQPRGEHVFATLVDFERELATHTRARRHEEHVLDQDLVEVEDQIARQHEAIGRAGLTAFDWGAFSELSSPDLAEASPVERELVESVLAEVLPDPLPRRSLRLEDPEAWPTTRASSYDLIVLDGALERSEDPEGLLRRCCDALRPGGRLVVAAPCLALGPRRLRGVTESALRSMLCEIFPPQQVEVRSYGNLLTCLAVVAGGAVGPVPSEALTLNDPLHPTVAVAIATAATGSRRRGSRISRREDGLPSWAPAAPVRGVVLAYHRIADLYPDTHRLCTPPPQFEAQMRLIGERFRPISLSRLSAELRDGTLATGSVAVTFDDGYLDNLEVASPLLAELGIPATFFVGARPPQSPVETWWDTVERILEGGDAVPERLLLELEGLRIDLPTGTRAERHAALRALHERLIGAAPELVQRGVDGLREWSGADLYVRDTHRLMTADEVLELSKRPEHEIGAHGMHHRLLPALAPAAQEAELVESKRELESLLELPVDSVAYPYGAADDTTVTIAAEAGFAAGCTVEGDPVTLDSDRLRLPRLEVRDEDLEAFTFRLDCALSSRA